MVEGPTICMAVYILRVLLRILWVLWVSPDSPGLVFPIPASPGGRGEAAAFMAGQNISAGVTTTPTLEAFAVAVMNPYHSMPLPCFPCFRWFPLSGSGTGNIDQGVHIASGTDETTVYAEAEHLMV